MEGEREADGGHAQARKNHVHIIIIFFFIHIKSILTSQVAASTAEPHAILAAAAAVSTLPTGATTPTAATPGAGVAGRHGGGPFASATPQLTSADLPPADRARLVEAALRRAADLITRHGLAAIRHVQAHRWAWPFNAPVDTALYPDYAKVVADPIDLGTVRGRVEAGGHYATPDAVAADVRRVFTNAQAFNPPGSDVHVMAASLARRFEERWAAAVAPRGAGLPGAAAADEAAALRRLAAARAAGTGLEGPFVGAGAGGAAALAAAAARARPGRKPGSKTAAKAALADAAARLGPALDELQARIASAKAAAAAATPPMAHEDKARLVEALAALPPSQFEGAVAVALAACPAMAARAQAAVNGGGGGAGGGALATPRRGGGGAPPAATPPTIDLDLAALSDVGLRQLEHFVAACGRVRSGGRAGGALPSRGGSAPPDPPPPTWPGLILGAGVRPYRPLPTAKRARVGGLAGAANGPVAGRGPPGPPPGLRPTSAAGAPETPAPAGGGQAAVAALPQAGQADAATDAADAVVKVEEDAEDEVPLGVLAAGAV
jgi:hypothetical protein